MSESLRILILEDNPADVELAKFELEEAGLVFISKVVMTENEYVDAIRDYCPDLILSDYDLPKFTGALALAEAKTRCPDTPFILVTGAVTEDRAIDILTQGAKDYVLKTRLQQRLVPAVQRALAEAKEHKERKKAEAELREAHRTLEERVKIRTAELGTEIETRKRTEDTLRQIEERQRLVLQASSMGTFEVDLLAGKGEWNATEFALLGLKPGDVEAGPDTFFPFVHPDDSGRLQDEWAAATRSGKLDTEFRVIRADGRECWLAGKGSFFFDGNPEGYDTGGKGNALRFMGVNFDITGRKQAEEAVSKSQETFHELVERSPFGTYVIDSQFRIAQMNTASQEGAFRNVRPVIGRNFTEAMHILWPEPVAAEIIASFRHTLDTGEPYYSPRFTNPRHDADIVESYEWELHRMTLPDGQYGVICYYFDSTRLREAEKALYKSEEKYRNLVQQAPTGIYDIDFATGRFTDVNDAMCQILGYTRDELLAMTASNILDDEGKALFALRIRRAQSGEPLDDAVEYRVRTKEGRLIWSILNTTFHWNGGRIVGATVVAHDVTERRQAEEALRKRERLLQDVIDGSTSPIFLKDIDGKFITVNASLERMLGMSREEIRGKTDYDIAPKEVADYWRTHDKEVMETGKAIQIEEVADLQDGHHIFLANKFPLVNAEGQIYGIGAISHDVTKRKHAEMELQERTKQLEDTNKELESFSYSVSHDLRAPLRAIDGYAKMILNKQGDEFDEDTRRKFDVIRNSSKMMGQLIDDLLALSRLGKEALSVSRLNMEELTGNVWEELKANNPGRPMDLKIGHLPVAMGDRSLMRQVLTNVLSNAVKFTRVREVPLIEVGGHEEGTEVVYHVRDNGVGFDMQYHDHLFGVFKRLHSSSDYEGTGVGLAIVERIIKKHGGRVWAEGKVDEGACFYFTLPGE